jgi:hypothetical protein
MSQWKILVTMFHKLLVRLFFFLLFLVSVGHAVLSDDLRTIGSEKNDKNGEPQPHAVSSGM